MAGRYPRLFSLALVAILAVLVRAEDRAPGLPPALLAGRIEQALQIRAPEFRANLTHYALLNELQAAEIERGLERVYFRWDGAGYWLGAGGEVEPHGGGLLAFLFAHWRPGGRPASSEDEFPFPANGRRLELGVIYQGHRRQIYLPTGNADPTDRSGTLPSRPHLARMHFLVRDGRGEATPVERDAYLMLGLLLSRESDLEASWVNRLGQTLTVDRLFADARDVFLTERPPQPSGGNHAHLHMVELLLKWHERSLELGRTAPVDPNALKRRFLDGDLDPSGAPVDTEVLAHRVEMLGRLAANRHVEWEACEVTRVRVWLERIGQEQLRDLDQVEIAYLAHLTKGLRLLAEHPISVD